MTNFIDEKYDVVVIGAGHAGCEAGLASANLDLKLQFLQSVWIQLQICHVIQILVVLVKAI